MRSVRASVKAPLTWPKISLSKVPSGQRAGIDGDQRPLRARRKRVEGLRHDFLARAVLAGDQHVGVGGADARHHLQHGLHGARLGDERGQAFRAQKAVLRLQHVCLALHAMQIELRAQHGEQPRIVPGLLDEVRGAAAHRFDSQLHAAPRRHHDDRHAQPVALNLRQQIDALCARGGVAGVVHVQQQRFVGLTRQALDDLARRRSTIQPVAFRTQQDIQRIKNGGLVVGNQQTRPLALLRLRAVRRGALSRAAHAGCHSTMAAVLEVAALRLRVEGAAVPAVAFCAGGGAKCRRRNRRNRLVHHSGACFVQRDA